MKKSGKKWSASFLIPVLFCVGFQSTPAKAIVGGMSLYDQFTPHSGTDEAYAFLLLLMGTIILEDTGGQVALSPVSAENLKLIPDITEDEREAYNEYLPELNALAESFGKLALSKGVSAQQLDEQRDSFLSELPIPAGDALKKITKHIAGKY
ncbi:hypothetical protein WDW86_10420 [Bdellovibrionota bacterium FG-2]